LGIEVRFIHKTPPAEHAQIERTHQTIRNQAIVGQTLTNVADLQKMLTGRIAFLNSDYPSRSLQGRAPLTAYPQAKQTKRPDRLEFEKEILNMQPIYGYLAKGRGFRQTGPVGMFSLGAQRYHARTRFAKQTLEITFNPHALEFICLPEETTQAIRLAAKGLTKEALIGELHPRITLPVYQLALPFSFQAWRVTLHSQALGDTTL
jgi:hypothetical protein